MAELLGLSLSDFKARLEMLRARKFPASDQLPASTASKLWKGRGCYAIRSYFQNWPPGLSLANGRIFAPHPWEIDSAWEARAKEAGGSRVRSFVVGQAFQFCCTIGCGV